MGSIQFQLPATRPPPAAPQGLQHSKLRALRYFGESLHACILCRTRVLPRNLQGSFSPAENLPNCHHRCPRARPRARPQETQPQAAGRGGRRSRSRRGQERPSRHASPWGYRCRPGGPACPGSRKKRPSTPRLPLGILLSRVGAPRAGAESRRLSLKRGSGARPTWPPSCACALPVSGNRARSGASREAGMTRAAG